MGDRLYRQRARTVLDRARPEGDHFGHGGLWSDNSIAMFAAIFRLHFPLNAHGENVLPDTAQISNDPDL